MKNGKRVLEAFSTNQKYFDMMEDWHLKHGGAAIEPEMNNLLSSNCRGNILDAGCGEGSIAHWLSEQHINEKFYGIDVSPIGIKKATSKNSKVLFSVGNLCELPYRGNSFNVVYSQSVLEHVPDYQYSLNEFYRVLKLKGKLIIRIENGGREDRTLAQSFFAYLFKKNKVKILNPSLNLRENNRKDHRSNFDAYVIPSDILVKQLKERGFVIKYFSTKRKLIQRDSEAYKTTNVLKRHLINLIMKLPFFPFTHMGPTTIIMAEK